MCSKTACTSPRRNRSGRRSAQTAIWRIGEALVRLLAPIMSFTAEEVWDYLPQDRRARSESVHLAQFPSADEILGDARNARRRPAMKDRARTGRRSAPCRDEVLKALEEARNNKLIGTGLEAQVALSALRTGLFGAVAPRRPTALPVHRFGGDAHAGLRQRHRRRARRSEESRRPEVRALLELFNPRRRGQAYPTVCERCSAVLKEIGEPR